jgi:hypothetical protein
MPLYRELSAAAQAAYANAATAAFVLDANRTAAQASGTFTSKLIGKERYWYHGHRTADGKVVQVYLGKSGPVIDELIGQRNDPQAKAAIDHAKRLANAAAALGCAEIIPAHAAVIDRLAGHGFFRAGGILIGTHAFIAYQNRFGALWEAGASTTDLDFAHPGGNLSVALPSDRRMDTRSAIESLNMGFAPNTAGTTYTKSDQRDFELDFVTSRGRSDKPVHVAALNVTLQPLRFMEYGMEQAMPAVLLTRRGPIVVNLPDPARYAVHKLVISGERPERMRVKARKDLMQVACLVDYLQRHDADSLSQAWADAAGRGPGWRKRMTSGLGQLAVNHPDLDLSFARGASTISPEPPPQRSRAPRP